MLLYCRSEDFFNVEARRFEDIVSCAFVVDGEGPLDLIFVIGDEDMSDAFVDKNDGDGVVMSLDGAFIVDDEEKLKVFVDDDDFVDNNDDDGVRMSLDGAFIVDDEERLKVFVDDDDAAVVKFSNDGAFVADGLSVVGAFVADDEEADAV